MTAPAPAAGGPDDLSALAKGGRTNIVGFILRLAARLPFLFIAGRLYGAETVGRFALAVLVIELAALIATLGLKRGLAQALARTDRPHAHVVWDAMVLALAASLIASAVLLAVPTLMFPNSDVRGLDRLLGVIVCAVACSDVSLAALAYRHNVQAAVTARAIVEPWTISIAAWALYYVEPEDGLIFAYVLSMVAALAASLVPFVRSYGLPHGWKPRIVELSGLARHNMPLAGADAIEWGTRNIDRFILGQVFPPAVVGIYYMAQQVASIPQRLKTSFDPVLGPTIARALVAGDRPAIARAVRQVGFWIMSLQACALLMGGIPAEGVMGVVGPAFVAGAAALVFLLLAEVLASPGAVAEVGLVYIARHRNLLISILLLGLQAALTLTLLFAARSQGLGIEYQAAAPALALAISVLLTSLVKCGLLGHMLGEAVFKLRPAWLGAVAAAGVVWAAFTALPHAYEWAELGIGVPAIFVTYFLVVGLFVLGPDDRALFRKLPRAQASDIAEGQAG